MTNDTSVNTNYTVDKREIKVLPDGTMAPVVEQTVVRFTAKYLLGWLLMQVSKRDNGKLIF
jgi:hypothetical protein